MLYMLTLYWNPNSSPVDGETALGFHLEFAKELREKNKYIISEALAGPDTAKTFRPGEGSALRTDGPFIETKEALAGFYIIDCDTEDEAASYAKRLVSGSGLGAVEVRPVAHLPVWPYDIAADRERWSM
jgi:hypothetical protein